MSKILIVEDEIEIADLERAYLEREQFTVLVANTGTDGLHKALTEEVDLILLDIMLPDMTGFQVCEKIRKEKNMPILFVSAKKEDADKITGLGLGADDYIMKPFSPSELIARVKAHLCRYERLVETNKSKHEVLEVKNLKMDPTSRRVLLREKEISLTSKEFDVLYFLATNPDVVYSKQQLFHEVWNMESLGEINTVTVHIKKIREKIEQDRTNPEYIETIWGVGYRFKA